MKVNTLNFSKAGSPQEESEDALDFNMDELRFSICDGAGDSIFSAVWAQVLSSVYVSGNFDLTNDAELQDYINSCRLRWFESIAWDSLKWNVKKKSVYGSYSTFLSATLNKTSKKVTVWARGDACFFLYDEDSMESFPITDPVMFGLHPELVWSGYGNPIRDKKDYKFPEFKKNEFDFGDHKGILMATDALSKYIMENGASSVWEITDHYSNREFFDELRSNGKMRNDDVSAIIISSL
ncbi:MAG: hypothetical protein ACYCUZ_00570 [Cuniculiplasma sp.]